jgi:hypothetical protein
MSLPVPRLSAVFELTRSAVNRTVDSAASVAALPGRAFAVVGEIEALVERLACVIDRAEHLLDRCHLVVTESQEAARRVAGGATAAPVAVEEVARVAVAAGAVAGNAEQVVGEAATVVAGTGRIAATGQELLSAYEPTLRTAAPMAGRFVEQVSQEEIDAAIRLINQLPRLTRHLTDDVLPILAVLDRVGPDDIHDLLDVTRDLRLAVAGIPGLNRLRRRGEDRLAEQDADEAPS